MCNLAGYIGTKTAAPILIEMMQRQEGWDGGYYTGIATICDGKLYADKVIGATDILLQLTDAANFPGTVGILHGRSKSGGDVRWAQPFVSGTGKVAHMANGTGGVFRQLGRQGAEEAYQELKAAGYTISSLTEGKVPPYGMFSDGYSAHSSDIRSNLIDKSVREGVDFADAVGRGFVRIPTESVSLALHADYPDRIAWGRVNYPMFLGFADHGTYMATTPMAFPEDVQSVTMLDPLSCGYVFADRYETKPITGFPGTVAPITPQVWHRCYDAIVAALSEKELDHDQLDLLVKPLFDPATCVQEAPAEYAVLYELQKQGRLEITKRYVPGKLEGLETPKLFVKLK